MGRPASVLWLVASPRLSGALIGQMEANKTGNPQLFYAPWSEWPDRTSSIRGTVNNFLVPGVPFLNSSSTGYIARSEGYHLLYTSRKK
jgi:hypothetical protein